MDHLEKCCDYLITCHPIMAFFERKNGKMYFLDVEVFGGNDKIVTTVYRNRTFSGIYIFSIMVIYILVVFTRFYYAHFFTFYSEIWHALYFNI